MGACREVWERRGGMMLQGSEGRVGGGFVEGNLKIVRGL